MRKPAAQHRILQFDLEDIRGPHAADRGERAAEHQRPFGEAAFAAEFHDQLQRIEHRRDGAFLVERPLAVFGM